jgi:hypothetical protein
LRLFRKKSFLLYLRSIYLRTFVLRKDVLKVALAVFAAIIVTVQAPLPEHAPDQPEKVELPVGEAAKVTDFPDS